jgi:crotonobetainyl-CoA:carnitine CoA-transferase CaiB-like acyl-CoA transferase
MTVGTDAAPDDAVAAWAASGAMALTGHPDGPPLSPGAAVLPALTSLAQRFTHLAALLGPASRCAAHDLDIDVGQLVSGRAGLLGLGRRGQVSANGSCRLLPAADGWVAVNLARPADVEAVDAVVERVVEGDPWDVLARSAEHRSGADLVERAVLLGIPAAVVPAGGPMGGGQPFGLRRLGASRPDGEQEEQAEEGVGPGRLVVDLSAMWAGPLCARLLGLAGMRVVKVESTRRPDGARGGDARFFDWLHGGHASVALDLATAGGREALAQLVAAADVVIESSRPRALAQLGIDVEAVVGARPGVTWVSITGHGRDGAAGRRVAFGDDAAAAAGLVAHDDRGRPVFCGDAIADPITGLSAAVGALTSVAAGGGHLVDVPMVGAVAATLAVPIAPACAQPSPDGGWHVATATGDHPVARPRELPPASAPAAALGADTAAVLRTLGRGAC